MITEPACRVRDYVWRVIVGLSCFNYLVGEFEARMGSMMNQIVRADEINRVRLCTQTALPEATQK